MPSCATNGSSRLSHGFFRIVRNGKHHETDFQLVFLRKLIVTLVMRGHAHDCASTVIHEDVVGHPNRNLFFVERIDSIAAGRHAVLFNFADVARFFGFALFSDELIDFSAEIGVSGR